MYRVEKLRGLTKTIPNPIVFLFCGTCAVFFASYILSTPDPLFRNHIVQVKNLCSRQNLIDFISQVPNNFANFPILGTVILMMFGITVADKSGLLEGSVHMVFKSIGNTFLTPTIVILGILSNITIDGGYLLIVPLGGLLFLTAKRNPILGVIVAFVAVSGCFSFNFFPSFPDVSTIGLVQQKIFDIGLKIDSPSYLSNIWFSISCSILSVLLIWIITDLWALPKLGKKGVQVDVESSNSSPINYNNRERKFILFFILSTILCTILLLTLSPKYYFTHSENQVKKIFSLYVPLISLYFFVFGAFYGVIAGKFVKLKDIFDCLFESIKNQSFFIVTCFFAAQFFASLQESHIGDAIAVAGSEYIKNSHWGAPLVILIFIILIAFLNLFIPSLTLLWTIICPIFLPVLVDYNIRPELIIAAFRVGDSPTNLIAPTLIYLPFILDLLARYGVDKRQSYSVLIKYAIPYSVALLLCFIIAFYFFYFYKIPFGIY